jgi:glycine cleavage system H lipoate-binding protein
VSKIQPFGEKELAFLKWVLADGQQYMKSFGYSDLASAESQSQLDKLTPASIIVSPVKDASHVGTILLIMAAVLMCGLVASALIRNYRKQREITPDFNDLPVAFDEESVVLPKGLYFDKTHTWAFMEKNGFVTVGIDDFIRHITGPITRVEMKKTGEKIKKGDVLFTIVQYGKQLNIYAPFTGTIKMQNEALLTDSSVINTSPYDKGWIYRMEPVNWIKDMQLLELSDKYRRWLDAEFSRMKDFLAAILQPESDKYAHVVLQDGGELKEGVLSDFGPEVWEDFQSNFLDTFR